MMRSFILLLGILTGLSVQAYTNLTDAYSALGFNPSLPGNKVVVVFSDAHLNLDPLNVAITTNLNGELVDIVNHMNPPAAKIVVSGDISTSLANVPGVVFGDYYRHYGTNELIAWKTAIQALTNLPATNIVWIPGNHDQEPFESDAETFQAIFPNMPPYQTFDLGGARFLLVNSGNYGEPSPREDDWLRQTVANTSPTQQVVVVTHQPPFHGAVIHRGVFLLLRELFNDWQSRWWLLAGHEHDYHEDVYDIGRSNVNSVIVGTANTNVFSGKSYGAGFMFLCMSNGIAGRIYYHYSDRQFTLLPEPNWSQPKHYGAAFEDFTGLNLLWRRLKTIKPSPEVVVTNSVDSRNWWVYPTELQWRLSLDRHGNRATHFLVLSQGLRPQNEYAFSSDQTNWIVVPLPNITNNVHAFSIPQSLINYPTIYFRLKGEAANDFIGGWGLATTGSVAQLTYPRLSSVPDQHAVAGKLLVLTNVAVDPYSPPDSLKFTLVDGPTNVSLGATSGVFTWRPPFEKQPINIAVTVRVSDDGTPKFFDEQQFLISVQPSQIPQITPPMKTNGLFLMQVYADTDFGYSVSASTNLVDWTEVLRTNPVVSPFEVIDLSTNLTKHFYRVEIKP